MSGIRTFHLRYFVNFHKFNQYLRYNFSLGSNSNLLRNYASAVEVQISEKMQSMLQKRFPKAKKIEVNDLSGGCGSMYEIYVETVEFEGLPLVKQHMLINETLKEQIKGMHGLTVKTKIPDGS